MSVPLGYCANANHTKAALVTLAPGMRHCCTDCADPAVPDPCSCDDEAVNAPHVDALPPSHPLAPKR